MLDFPNSPTGGQTYTSGGVVWSWDGAKWVTGTTANAWAPIDSPVFTGNPTAPNQPAGDKDTSIANTAFVNAAVAPAFNGVGRNFIHNPLFNVAQRGAGPFTTSVYGLDRWTMTANLDTISISQAALVDSDKAVIGDEAATFCLQNVFTGNAGAAAYSFLNHRIEDVRRLSNKTVTLSFWANGAAGLKLGIVFAQIFGTSGSPSPQVSTVFGPITLVGGNWGRYSATVTLPSIATKNFGPADYTQLQMVFSSGATNNTALGSPGVQSGVIRLWGVQLEIGSVATPLEKPDPRFDLSNCQRFYVVLPLFFGGYSVAGNLFYTTISLPTSMRAIPQMTFATPTYGSASGLAQHFVNDRAVGVEMTSTATGTSWVSTALLISADL